jgi:hypothetical protein
LDRIILSNHCDLVFPRNLTKMEVKGTGGVSYQKFGEA